MSELENEMAEIENALNQPMEEQAPQDAPEPEPEGGPERGPDGRFLPKEEKLYAGKYKSVEEMERAYQEAESHIGRLEWENAQARQQAQPPQQQGPPPDVSALEELEPNEIAQFALASLQNNDRATYQRALDVLYDVAPRMAGDLQSRVISLEYQYELSKQLAPTLQASHENVNKQAMDTAWRSFTGKFPDAGQYEEALTSIMAEDVDLQNRFEQGNIAEKEKALETLYALARLRTTTAPSAEPTSQGPAELSGLEKRLQAAVASSGNVAGEVKPKSGLDQFYDWFDQEMGLLEK